MTMVVAVLLTHMLRNAVTAMSPAIMQAPDVQGAGQQEAAEKQKDQGMGVGRRGRLEAAQPEQREQDDRKQRRHGERQGLGHPPERHPNADRGGPPALLAEAVGRRAGQNDRRRGRAGKQTDEAVAREARVRALMRFGHGTW
jgi:hypothetical protein